MVQSILNMRFPVWGRRIDVILLIGPVIFVVEFKVGEKNFTSYAIDQTWDYALDLKNFHETSHNQYVAPVLVATEAVDNLPIISLTHQNDRLYFPIKTNASLLNDVIDNVLAFEDGECILQSLIGRVAVTVLLLRLLKQQWLFIMITLLTISHEKMLVRLT